MKIVLFYHSLVSDWNHGNAHFLRGVATELVERGHDVRIYEPRYGWSLTSLVAEYGESPLAEFAEAYPSVRSCFYEEETLELTGALRGADIVIVHEWNSHALVESIGGWFRRGIGTGDSWASGENMPFLLRRFGVMQRIRVGQPACFRRFEMKVGRSQALTF